MSVASLAVNRLGHLCRSVSRNNRGKKTRQKNRTSTSIRRPSPRLETLEDRCMLAADVYPDLPGLHLVDPRPDQFEGQIIYLDFDGEQDVTYNGPIVVEGINIPAFEALGELAGQEQAIIANVVMQLEATFADTGIIFTTIQPANDSEYSTIYIGGDDSAFREYGNFLGLAETIDVGNRNKIDEAFVFAREFTPSVSTATAANTLAHTIKHEAGHLLGFTHDNGQQGTLEDFAYSGTVYWGARDIDWTDWNVPPPLNPVNHHFMVIRFNGAAPPSWDNVITLDTGHNAVIVGGFNNQETGKLETRYQNAADVQATNDWFFDGNFTGPWDPELHVVDIPIGHDFDRFSTTLYELTQAYDNAIDFALGFIGEYAQNCATFVNTMMAKAGVSEADRVDAGEFWGVDWGEENILYSGHFRYMTGISSSASSVTRGTDFTITATTTATDALEKVDFYEDSDGNGSLNLFIDDWIGSDLDSSDGWDWDVSTDNLAVGDHWFFAHAP